MKKLLYTDNVVITNTAIRKTHPQPNAKFEIGEHTDITYGLADMASKPRRMDLGLFIWIKDVGPKTAPLMYRPKSHLQIAQWMDDRPTYLTKSTDINNYVNMQDTHSRPAGHAKHPDDWPDLEFEDPIPVVGHAGQVSVVNQAAIHPDFAATKAHRLTLLLASRGSTCQINAWTRIWAHKHGGEIVW